MASVSPVDPSTVSTDDLGDALATQLQATVLERGTALTGGTSRPRLVLEGPAFGKGEGRFYLSDQGFVVFAYYATNGDWDATAAIRRQFFENVALDEDARSSAQAAPVRRRPTIRGPRARPLRAWDRAPPTNPPATGPSSRAPTATGR